MTDNQQAALDHASQGKPVFPCDRNKKPLTPNGFKDATTNPDTIRQWWVRNPGAFIGIPTGAFTGVIVIDIDLPEGPSTLAQLAPLPPTLEQRTGSGGRHLFFKHPGFTVKNSAGKIGPGVDVRGDGGYFIAAPSPGYEWLNSLPLAPAPLWLLTLITGQPAKDTSTITTSSPYGQAALSSELADLKATPEGGRNARLNVAAFSLAQLVAGGELDNEQTISALLAVALEIGLTKSEATATIRSGMEAGSREPRQGNTTPFPSGDQPLYGKFKGLFIDGNSLQVTIPKIETVIKGVIECECTGLEFGPPAGGKSFIALDMGLCCATGMPWAGHDTRQGSVIYLAGEGHHGMSRRIRAWSRKHGEPNLSLFQISKQIVNLETDMHRIVEEIKDVTANAGIGPVLIIIDTLARHISGDENSSKDMSRFINSIDYLRKHFPGCSALIVHHTGNDQENMHRARGSSALKAACDFEISCNKGLLTFTKMKDSETPKPVEFKLEQVEIGNDEETGEPITSCVVIYGERSERNKSADFTRIEAIAIRALVEVSAKEKRSVNGKYVANTNAWREAFYQQRKGEDSEVSTAALKKAFQRILSGLNDKSAIEQVSTDSILILDNHQDQINAAIMTQNIYESRRGQGTLWGQSGDMSPI